MPGRSPASDQETIGILKAEVERLHAAIIRLEALAAGHRADFERERARSERLMAELLEVVTDRMSAREKAARLEGELAGKRLVAARLLSLHTVVTGLGRDVRGDNGRRWQ
jgi:hypothetical protein